GCEPDALTTELRIQKIFSVTGKRRNINQHTIELAKNQGLKSLTARPIFIIIYKVFYKVKKSF
ncbi:MAG TPA: hypothetical protein DD697_00340, partial [Candidatus Komeilibacteria bacterium]|nr:hypothetical protein [Candidatus Komeilibacteria bacterium]